MSVRYEFVALASGEGANMSLLCRRFGISRKTGYKWLHRYEVDGEAGLRDRSRRPLTSPRQTVSDVAARVLALRGEHPAWGGRKVRRRLQDLGDSSVPSASTITEILRRHGEITASASESRRRRWQRFEHALPNALWQMDFKGAFRLATGRRCHPLTVLDDHSRFNILLQGCLRPDRREVQAALTSAFRRYGLPAGLLSDNGSPWCARHAGSLTRLALWLMRLGIAVIHGRVGHPQTQGKDERFHRTLVAEVLSGRQFRDPRHVQGAFDRWRPVYNHERPHEALGLATPSMRYQPSPRAYPSSLPPVTYEPGCVLRKVHGGTIRYAGRPIWVGKTLEGERVALRPTRDGAFRLCYGSFAIGQIDLASLPRGHDGHVRLFASFRSAALGEEPGSPPGPTV